MVGLIGWPVGHSISPAMHNAAFRACKLDWCYVPLPVDPSIPDAVANAVRGLAALGFSGANVTVPHKQSVMAVVDELSPAAHAIGAVNTISVVAGGKICGDNTDARGFVSDIEAHGFTVAGKSALLLGAGGSARAVAYGLAEAGCATIVIANRTYTRAVTLCNQLQLLFSGCVLVPCHMPEDLPQWQARSTNNSSSNSRPDIIVNCTSLGMSPNRTTSPWPDELEFVPDQFVYDLVYNPRETRFLQKARAAGSTAVGGLGMLIRQGAIAFSIWTGMEAPVSVMEKAVNDAMAAMARS